MWRFFEIGPVILKKWGRLGGRENRECSRIGDVGSVYGGRVVPRSRWSCTATGSCKTAGSNSRLTTPAALVPEEDTSAYHPRGSRPGRGHPLRAPVPTARPGSGGGPQSAISGRRLTFFSFWARRKQGGFSRRGGGGRGERGIFFSRPSPPGVYHYTSDQPRSCVCFPGARRLALGSLPVSRPVQARQSEIQTAQVRSGQREACGAVHRGHRPPAARGRGVLCAIWDAAKVRGSVAAGEGGEETGITFLTVKKLVSFSRSPARKHQGSNTITNDLQVQYVAPTPRKYHPNRR